MRANHAFLFGAGASYGSGGCEPSPPPLGNQLYNRLEPILREAHRIDENVKMIFRNDFEAGMDELMKKDPSVMQSFQQDMARYFVQFEPGLGNHYRELIHAIDCKDVSAVLATLNYDILLERSAEMNGLNYHHIVSAPATKIVSKACPIFKLHGSCNIVPHTEAKISGFRLKVPVHGIPRGVRVGGVEPDYLKSLDRNALYKWLDDQDTLVPCIGLYHASKMIRDGASYFVRLQEFWVKELQRSDTLFVIGVRLVLHDEHIWGPISKFKGKVHWISPNADDALAWAKENGVKMIHLANDFNSFIPMYHQLF